MNQRACATAQSQRQPDFEVVAALLSYGERICLLRRSPEVSSDKGLWHCVTGYLPPAQRPFDQALLEIDEETGIGASSLELADSAVFDEPDAHGNLWRVHAFHFHCGTEAVRLNWEHDGACWVSGEQLRALPTVAWLDRVMRALLKPARTDTH